MTDTAKLIEKLGLTPHPEGGYYRRTHLTPSEHNERGQMSAIYYLLEGPDFALWHKVDADELWFWHGGSPLTLEIVGANKEKSTQTLGANILGGEMPQITVPANAWQRARAEGAWTLVSCAVSPGFLFDTYELAEAHFNPQD